MRVQLAQQAKEILGTSDLVIITERVDTAALQILCAFFRDAEVNGLVVQWQHPSPALQNAARLLNVSTCLALSGG